MFIEMFLFVQCFVVNLVNGLRSFLRRVIGLFYVKIFSLMLGIFQGYWHHRAD